MWEAINQETFYKRYHYIISDKTVITVEAWKPASLGTWNTSWDVDIFFNGYSAGNIKYNGRYSKKKVLEQVWGLCNGE